MGLALYDVSCLMLTTPAMMQCPWCDHLLELSSEAGRARACGCCGTSLHPGRTSVGSAQSRHAPRSAKPVDFVLQYTFVQVNSITKWMSMSCLAQEGCPAPKKYRIRRSVPLQYSASFMTQANAHFNEAYILLVAEWDKGFIPRRLGGRPSLAYIMRCSTGHARGR